MEELVQPTPSHGPSGPSHPQWAIGDRSAIPLRKSGGRRESHPPAPAEPCV